jgi:hypothetical protein
VVARRVEVAQTMYNVKIIKIKVRGKKSPVPVLSDPS